MNDWRSRLGIAFGFVVGVSVAAIAEEAGEVDRVTPGRATHLFEGAALLYWRSYREEDISPLESAEKGFLPGFRARYTFQSPTPIYRLFARVGFDYTNGDTDFHGTNQRGTAVIRDETRHELYDLEGNLGLTVDDPAVPVPVSVYTGFGYWRWKRGLGGATPFEEEYTRMYVPFGLRVDYELSDEIQLGFDAAAHVMVDGQIDVEGFPGLPASVELDLGNQVGARTEASITFQLVDFLSLRLGPWYRLVNIAEGETRFGIFEPESHAHEIGGAVGLAFSL